MSTPPAAPPAGRMLGGSGRAPDPRQSLQDELVVLGRLDLAQDLDDPPLGVEHEGGPLVAEIRAAVHRLLHPHAVAVLDLHAAAPTPPLRSPECEHTVSEVAVLLDNRACCSHLSLASRSPHSPATSPTPRAPRL